MITLTSAPNASTAALAGLQQAMDGAGRSIAALSSGEVQSAAAAPSAGAASVPAEPADKSVGTRLNELA